MSRPTRIVLEDFDGKKTTLPDNAESWEIINDAPSAEPPLVLGLGPAGTPPNLAGQPFLWIEEPSTLERLLACASFALPLSGQRAAPENIRSLTKDRRVYFYRSGLKLAPEFWGPLLSAARAGERRASPNASLAWLPGDDRSLLWRELRDTLPNRGFERVDSRSFANPGDFLRAFEAEPPGFALSVNFRGLDPEGHIFYLCRELGVPLAVWMVDNPWHLLSSLRLPWWRHVPIFTTDRGFIEPLKAYGAKRVFHCPLAYAPHMRRDSIDWSPRGAPLFVGRSCFPDQASFFGRSPLPPGILREANALFERGEKPDYRWFASRLGSKLWPGLAGRLPGKGADYFSAKNRAAWISGMQDPTIIGDEGWRDFFPRAKLLPPVDYYASLPGIYASAGYALNATSLLLPQSLSQRHFDVWAAGGLLLSDDTDGLEIFPEELVDPIRLGTPAEIREKWSALKDNPSRTRDLIAGWREIIFREHGYEERIRRILSLVENGEEER